MAAHACLKNGHANIVISTKISRPGFNIPYLLELMFSAVDKSN